MIRIAICDDNKSDIKIIEKSVVEVFSRMNIYFDIDTFTDAFVLLRENLDSPYNLIFLDIDMPQISGMDVAGKLNSQINNSEIIFVTNHDELVYKAYRFKALGFIRKKYLDVEVEEIIELFIEHTNQNRNFLVIHDSGTDKKVSINDIIYIQSDDHYMDIYKIDGKEIIRKSLNDIEKEYGAYGFIRIHKRYLVNYRYIYSIEKKTVILKDNKQLPLSRSKINTVKDSFQLFSRRI